LSNKRSGVVLVAALVLLVLAALICGVLMKVGLTESRQVRHDAQQLQAGWLAESAVERAAAKLAETPDYAGETWELSADAIGGEWPATVRITVMNAEDETNHRTVRIQADYPPDERWRVRFSKEVVVGIKTQANTPGNSGAKP
jgi:type II secretory pathway component PulK